MTAVTIATAQVDLTLNQASFDAGLRAAKAKVDSSFAQSAKKFGMEMSRASEALGKVANPLLGVAGGVGGGAIRAFIKSGSEEAKKLQTRLNDVKSAWAGLGGRLANQKIFGKDMYAWAESLAKALNSIDASKLAKLLEIAIVLKGLQVGSGIAGGISKLVGSVSGSRLGNFVPTAGGTAAGMLFGKGLSGIGNYSIAKAFKSIGMSNAVAGLTQGGIAGAINHATTQAKIAPMRSAIARQVGWQGAWGASRIQWLDDMIAGWYAPKQARIGQSAASVKAMDFIVSPLGKITIALSALAAVIITVIKNSDRLKAALQKVGDFLSAANFNSNSGMLQDAITNRSTISNSRSAIIARNNKWATEKAESGVFAFDKIGATKAAQRLDAAITLTQVDLNRRKSENIAIAGQRGGTEDFGARRRLAEIYTSNRGDIVAIEEQLKDLSSKRIGVMKDLLGVWRQETDDARRMADLNKRFDSENQDSMAEMAKRIKRMKERQSFDPVAVEGLGSAFMRAMVDNNSEIRLAREDQVDDYNRRKARLDDDLKVLAKEKEDRKTEMTDFQNWLGSTLKVLLAG